MLEGNAVTPKIQEGLKSQRTDTQSSEIGNRKYGIGKGEYPSQNLPWHSAIFMHPNVKI